MKTSKLLLIISLMVLISILGLQGDDRSIFSGATKPYIMFILDNSGSMEYSPYMEIAHYTEATKLANFQTYTTSTGATYAYGTWQTGDYHYAHRLTTLKRVATELVDQFRDDVLIGTTNFFYDTSNYAHGGVVTTPITDFATTQAGSDSALNSLTNYINYTITADRTTPLAETMDTIYGYFAGSISASDGNRWLNKDSQNRIPSGSSTPVQFTCQKSFVILITDGLPTQDEFGDTGAGGTGFGYGYGYPYTGASRSLPDMALYMYENPITPSYSGIVTYTVGLLMSGEGQTLLQTTADADHGHGKYFPGNNYSELKDSLLTAIISIIQSNYAFTGYTSPKKLVTGGQDKPVSYSGWFLSNADNVPIWQGHLSCLEIVEVGATFEFQEQWDAAEVMRNQDINTRYLTTSITDTDNHQLTEIPFETVNKALLVNPMNVAGETIPEDASEDIIEFIRAVSTSDRPTDGDGNPIVLADIFHSDITFVGKPLRWKAIYNPVACNQADPETDPDCYQYFYETYQYRDTVIHVGTNDGVVHTINGDYDPATGGREISGYIPDEILPKLRNMAIDSQYTYTADGRMTANDIYTGGSDYWRTVLVFGLREGGKAYYCRDITYPHYQQTKWRFPKYEASASITLISGTDFTYATSSGSFAIGQYVVNEQRTAKARITADSGTVLTLTDIDGTFAVGEKILALPWYTKYIGETWGKPVIQRIKYKKGAGATVEKWVTILTGGLGDGTDEEGKSIFILDAWTGDLIWWLGYKSSGNDITDDHYLSSSSHLNYPIPQSLTAVDTDNNTYLDAIYFGNLGGNMFKVDISNPLTTTWIPQLLLRQDDTTQPIYQSPSVSYTQDYELWLHFGTGNRDDPQAGPTGKFIALKDDGTIGSSGAVLATDLQDLSTLWGGGTLAETTITGTHGWYFDFPDTNEILFDPDPMVISDYTSTRLYFNSYQPVSIVVGGDPCGSGGNMKFYVLDLFKYGDKVAGTSESGRISGGGMLGVEYLLYEGTGETGSVNIKDFKRIKTPYPGRLIFFKEKKR
jgi:hypothetical protein